MSDIFAIKLLYVTLILGITSFTPYVATATLVIKNTNLIGVDRKAKSYTYNDEVIINTFQVSGKNTSNSITQIPVFSQTDKTNLIPITEESDQDRISSNVGLSLDPQSMSQITPVSQLADVQPSDWALQALQSLVERYGVAGNLDRNFRGSEVMTRYEFAAGLNAVLQRVNELINSDTAVVTQADLATLRKLQEEFTAENQRDRLDALEVRTQQLADQQSSTTTQLNGSVIFALNDVFSNQTGIDHNTVLQQRVRLNFDTSFTGKDRLRTRLAFGNFELFDLPTNEGRLGFDSNTDGVIEIGDVEYRFPFGERVTVFVEINDAGVHDFTDVINPFFADSDRGAISRFGRRNPIYRIPSTNAGLGASVKLSDALSFDFGYLAGEGNNPNSGSGLFNGDYGAIGQLTFTPGDYFALGLTYIHSYAGAGQGLDSGTGSLAAQLNQISSLEIKRPVVGNSYGIEASYRISEDLAIGGWIGYTAARVIGLGDAEIWNYALTLAFPDLGKQGNLGGIIIGMQPKLTGTSDGLRAVGQFRDPDTSLHIEGFYRYQVTDNISITPGLIWLTVPSHNEDNDDIVIGTIRTTFEF